jgi:hypothetical protein
MNGFVAFGLMIFLFGRDHSLFRRAAFPAFRVGNCPDRITQVADETHDFSADRVPSRRRTGKIPELCS